MVSDRDARPPPGAFHAEVVVEDGQPVVMMRGEIDLATADRLDTVLTQALAAGPRMVLDLRDITFMDSTGINALVAAIHQLGPTPGRIVLRDPADPVRRVLAVAGIDHLFHIQTS